MNPAGSFSWSTRSPFFTASAAGDRESRVMLPRCITCAALSARPQRRIRQRRSGEAVPGDGAAPCRPESNLPAADARVLFPIA